jgi:hypothetical protein
MSGNHERPTGNIFETGKVYELRQVMTVTDLPEGGVRIGDSFLGDHEDATSYFNDSRLSSKDIAPGDIVRIEMMGPSACRVEEVYREGLRIFPARKGRKVQLVDLAESRRHTKLQIQASRLHHT